MKLFRQLFCIAIICVLFISGGCAQSVSTVSTTPSAAVNEALSSETDAAQPVDATPLSEPAPTVAPSVFSAEAPSSTVTVAATIKTTATATPKATATPTQAADIYVPCSKTVYSLRNKSLHDVPDDNKGFCQKLSVGSKLKVIATNGTWYKVEYEYLPEGYAYVMCKYVTENADTVTFDEYNITHISDTLKNATVKEGKKGVNLTRDLSEEQSNIVIYLPYSYANRGNITVIGLNKAGDWARVRFSGEDVNGAHHDGSKIYYMPTRDVIID